MPYRDNGHLTAGQKKYNVRHSATRSVTELQTGTHVVITGYHLTPKEFFMQVNLQENMKAVAVVYCLVNYQNCHVVN